MKSFFLFVSPFIFLNICYIVLMMTTVQLWGLSSKDHADCRTLLLLVTEFCEGEEKTGVSEWASEDIEIVIENSHMEMSVCDVNMERTYKIFLSLPERVWLTHWLSKTDLICPICQRAVKDRLSSWLSAQTLINFGGIIGKILNQLFFPIMEF